MKQTLCISLSLFIWSCSENNFNDSDLSTSFYENDQKKEEGYMKDEKKQGRWTAWYENGNVKTKGKFTFEKIKKISNLFNLNVAGLKDINGIADLNTTINYNVEKRSS